MSRIFLLSVMLLLLWTPMSKAQAGRGDTPLWARSDRQSVLIESRNPFARSLVQTVVTAKSKAKSEDGTFALTFTITEVYWGSDTLVGMTFEGRTGTEDRFSLYLDRGIPPFDEGTQRICTLIYDHDQIYPIKGSFGFAFPVSDKEQPLYKEAQAQAKAIQKLRGLSREAQINLLKQYAEKEDLAIKFWSLTTLGALKDEKPATVAFLEQLLKAPQRELQIQIRMEELLDSLQGKEWQNSSQRIALFKRWVDGNHDAQSWYDIFSRLDFVSQDQQTDKSLIFNSLATLVDNVVVTDDLGMQAVTRSVNLMGKIAKAEPADQMDLRNRVFNLLIQKIKNAKGFDADSLQLFAAKQIDSFTQLSAAQIAEIVAVQKEITNQEAAALLQKMLQNHAKPVDEPKTTVIE